ncbi:MAG: DUF4097 family beta strand repeat-containing protein [Acidobacteriota bacterium]
MSWLYSIVFAGLLFSSSGTVPSNLNFTPAAKAPSERAKQDETEKFEQTYPLSATGRVSVSNVNGSITVEAWDRNEVHLEAIKTADSKETLADVDIKVDSRPDTFSVEADYGSWKQNRDGGWKTSNRRIEVQFRLQVPRTAVLNEVETVNGSVTVSNFSNFTKISAVNGDVTATNLRGAAELSTVNGQVAADFDQLAPASRINLSTVNGRVNLVIPSDANAMVKADSLNGNISNDFGLPVRKGKYIGRDLHGRLGGGQVPIKLNSVNGPLTIGRRNDGKALSPATNLLQQKKDDEDWDDDSDGMSGADKQNLNRDIQRAMRDSQRQTANAMRDAQKEIAKVNLEELAKIKVNVDTEKIEAQVRDSLARQKDALVRIDNIRWQGQVPTIEKKSKSFPVKGVPKVTIDAKGCSVKVRGWDKPEVQYVLTRSSNRRDTSEIVVTENVSESSVNLKVPTADNPGLRGFRYGDSSDMRIEVFVPKKSDLTISTDGEIRLDGVTGNIELNGEDESINVRDVEGTLKLAAADGEVRVVGFNGAFDSKTSDADVYLEGVFSKLTARSTNGNVTITVPENANLSLASNTEVEEQGVRLTKTGEGVWQLGSGGSRFNFEFADGNLVVRNASLLNSN